MWCNAELILRFSVDFQDTIVSSPVTLPLVETATTVDICLCRRVQNNSTDNAPNIEMYKTAIHH
jgi:hypothetical protein